MVYKPLTKENVKDFKNFKYSEYKCKCKGKYCNGYPVPFSYDLAKILQKIRNHFGKAVNITSPLRCEKWNAKQGGVKNSKHKKGWACDFYVSGVSYSKLKAYVKTLNYVNYYYNVSGSVMHLDIKPPAYTEPKEEPKIEVISAKTELELAQEEIINLKSQIESEKNINNELQLVNDDLRNKIQNAIEILKEN